MVSVTVRKLPDELRAGYEFDFASARRGKYAKETKAGGTNIVVLDLELMKAFSDSASVNAALRSLVEFAKLSANLTGRSITTKHKAV